MAELETFRKEVKNLISQFKKSEVVEHFKKQEIARSTVYNTINRIQIGEPVKDNKRTGGPTTWAASTKKKLKRLTNN